ncbi:MAG: hypothetical protein LR015_15895 [Verrucomicrobia bacterium]|nr:hypothetical protein [Verrucomicrobiota bacterium]
MPHGLRMDPRADVMPITTIPHKDSGVWGPPALRCYLAETGDFDLLNLSVPYVDGGEDSIYGHVVRNLEWLLADRTARGLSRIGQGDWNDPLNMAGPDGKGESIWLTEALAYALEQWAEVAGFIGKTEDAKRFIKEAEACRKAVNEQAWDGQWYQRATSDDGSILGSSTCAEGRIFINAQSWALIGKVADEQRFASLRTAVRELLDTPAGPAILLPAYEGMRRNVGKITLKTPGTGENGSVYCHAVVFWAYGLFLYRDADSAWRYLRCLVPGGEQGRAIRDADQLPVYIPNFYRGPTYPEIAGKSSHSPNTGTSAWYLRTVVDGLLGCRAELDGLTVDPQLPSDWPGMTAVRRFRGATYEIQVVRADAGNPRRWCWMVR